jgi:hypothetical protein
VSVRLLSGEVIPSFCPPQDTIFVSLPADLLENEDTMAEINHLNVYSGPDSVRKYFDPDCQLPLPLVEIPECLNPYRADGVRIYAKMMSMHPATNVKVMPGWLPYVSLKIVLSGC